MVRWWLLVHCGDASLNSCDVAVVRKPCSRNLLLCRFVAIQCLNFHLACLDLTHSHVVILKIKWKPHKALAAFFLGSDLEDVFYFPGEISLTILTYKIKLEYSATNSFFRKKTPSFKY